MILLHDVVEIFHLPNADGGAVLLAVALHGGFIVVMQKVNGLAVLVHGTLEIAPLAFDLDVRLVHPPVDPHRPLTAVEGLCQLRLYLTTQRLVVE